MTTINIPKFRLKPFLGILFLVLAFSCKSVDFAHKAYVNDAEMILSMRQLEKMELNFQLYREGSAGANGGKSGGGCGCN